VARRSPAARRKAAYRALLRDPRWQKKRLQVLERDQWACQGCGTTTRELHVHHTWYTAGVLPWDYPGACYVTLCRGCHAKQRKAPRRKERRRGHTRARG
jgi:5-methylcytosine-specific restriction endonuclease McrA